MERKSERKIKNRFKLNKLILLYIYSKLVLFVSLDYIRIKKF